MQSVMLTTEETRKLLSCSCPDAVTLYLYRKSKQPLETALEALHFTASQMLAAKDCLLQLGLWETAAKPALMPEKPIYTDSDLREAMRDNRAAFSKLVGEAQRRLGRTLSTEELKTLLSFTDYLRLPTEVVGLLLNYCIERNRRKGIRAPSMRTIEKEAYHWADEGIDTIEAACFHVEAQRRLFSRVQQLRLMLQLDNRKLTADEDRYLTTWISMGFPDEAINLAYERTCNQIGSFKWAYMNSILKSWHEKQLHTPQEIAEGDSVRPAPKKRDSYPRDGYQRHGGKLSPLAKRAVQSALEENGEE